MSICCGGSEPAQAPRWMLVDKASGVQIAEIRGDRARTSEDRWLYTRDLRPLAPSGSVTRSAPVDVTLPDGVGAHDRWIDVELGAQRLTAYEGGHAIASFAVSTGVGADGQPYSTPKGTHRIYAKLRATTMASAPGEARPYRFEAVPDVQYFDREVALHGAYWHRRFGERVSHGCVNLAPPDAAWLFRFTSPALLASEREQAVHEPERGTIVRVR